MERIMQLKRKTVGDIFLEGGARSRKSRGFFERVFPYFYKPSGTYVKEIKRREIIGDGLEGEVYHVDVIVEKAGGKRHRVLHMAEKEFNRRTLRKLTTPVTQFRVVNGLIKLNIQKKLGLRIVRTFRLHNRKGRIPGDKKRQILIMTALEHILDGGELNDEQAQQYREDRARQLLILYYEGYYGLARDNFFPQFDPKAGKCVAIMCDFGGPKRSLLRKILRRMVRKDINPEDILE